MSKFEVGQLVEITSGLLADCRFIIDGVHPSSSGTEFVYSMICGEGYLYRKEAELVAVSDDEMFIDNSIASEYSFTELMSMLEDGTLEPLK